MYLKWTKHIYHIYGLVFKWDSVECALLLAMQITNYSSSSKQYICSAQENDNLQHFQTVTSANKIMTDRKADDTTNGMVGLVFLHTHTEKSFVLNLNQLP